MPQLIKKWWAHKGFLYELFLFFFLSTLVLTLSPQPEKGLERLDFVFFGIKTDKYVHFLLFLSLGSSFVLAFNKRFFFGLFLLLSFGLLIEILQEMMPYDRFFDWLDFLADGLGLISGLVAGRFFSKKSTQKVIYQSK